MPTASDNRNPWSARKEGGGGTLLPDFYIPKKTVEKRGETGCYEWVRDTESDLHDATRQRQRRHRKENYYYFLH